MADDKCVVCKKVIGDDQQAVMCDTCSKWSHRKCKTGITKAVYDKSVRDGTDIPFVCVMCKAGEETSTDSLPDIPVPKSPQPSTSSRASGVRRVACTPRRSKRKIVSSTSDVDSPPPKRKTKRGKQTETTAERTARFRKDRVESLQKMVTEMNEDSCRKLLLNVAERMPELVFDISSALKKADDKVEPEKPNTSIPDWCTCHNCQDMPSDAENLCCGTRPQNCISQRPEFDLYCLEPGVLDIANVMRNDVLVLAQDDDINRRRRHAAYRQFVLWRCGHLGAGNRVVVPSCCVLRIRRTFPDRNRQYRGFLPNRLV